MGRSKKHQLSQRQWLNIIIFSISAAFLLFVLLGKMLNDSLETVQLENNYQDKNIAQNNQLLLTQIDFGNIQIHYIDAQWKSESLSPEYAEAIGQKWFSLLQNNEKENNLLNTQFVEKYNESKEKKLEITVLLYFHENTQPLISKIIKKEDYFKIIFIQSKINLILPNNQFYHYYPNQIID